MKRSRSIRLVQMSAAALVLVACDDPVEVGVFETVDQCTLAGNGAADCERALAAAVEQHPAVAPRYASLADCEGEFGAGQCTPAPEVATTEAGQAAQAGHGSFFMPLMAGYMMGRMMGPGAVAQPLYRPAAAAPGAGTAWHTATGTRVAQSTGMTRVPSTLAQQPRPQTTTLSRGGFGAQAARFGGGAAG